MLPVDHTPSPSGPVFIKPCSTHLQNCTQDFTAVQTDKLSEPVRHIIVTTALLESRAHLYAGYLASVFAGKDPRWLNAVKQWNQEEAQHGRTLMRLSARLPMSKSAPELLSRYLADVPYHQRTGVSVRGSIGRELVARCVVEALASTYYRVLSDACQDAPLVRTSFSALAKDEARHFGMFRRMLQEERGLDVALATSSIIVTGIRRMLALEDEQIGYASYLACMANKQTAVDSVFSRRLQAHIYAQTLYPLYRYRHLKYAAGMLLLIVDRRSTTIQTLLAATLWLGIQGRIAMAKVVLRARLPRMFRSDTKMRNGTGTAT